MKSSGKKKKKIFVLTVSRHFPQTHKRAGYPTGFVESLINPSTEKTSSRKIHTIRSNFDLWEKRAAQINSGEAILSLRYWSGKPYNSPQVEFLQLETIGVEKLHNPKNGIFAPIGQSEVNWEEVAENDGLSFVDFCEWFKHSTEEPMVVIHFTDFRYSK